MVVDVTGKLTHTARRYFYRHRHIIRNERGKSASSLCGFHLRLFQKLWYRTKKLKKSGEPGYTSRWSEFNFEALFTKKAAAR